MYFSKFLTIQYNGQTTVNILARVRVNEKVRQNTSAFLPYDLEYSQRVDSLAADYYDDAEFDWLVMLANNIVDPYYDWYLNDQVFAEYIALKYGSYVTALQTVDHYDRNPTDPTDPYDDVVVNPDTYAVAPDAVLYFAKNAYDLEVDNNNDRRLISLVNREVKFQAVEDLERLMNDRQK